MQDIYWWFWSEHHAVTVFTDGFIWKRKLDEAYNFLT